MTAFLFTNSAFAHHVFSALKTAAQNCKLGRHEIGANLHSCFTVICKVMNCIENRYHVIPNFKSYENRQTTALALHQFRYGRQMHHIHTTTSHRIAGSGNFRLGEKGNGNLSSNPLPFYVLNELEGKFPLTTSLISFSSGLPLKGLTPILRFCPDFIV